MKKNVNLEEPLNANTPIVGTSHFDDLVAWACHMYIVHEAGKKLKGLGCGGEYSAPGSM